MSVMSTVSYDDFAKLDIRVAKIIGADPIEGKSKIIKGRIDLGDDDQRDVIIGGAQYYQPEDLVGKNVIVIANLEPKKMAGVESNAMLLAADVDDKPFWLTVKEDVPLGSPIK
jgi:tRNA-binding protein